jgi:hypothetical protein
MRGARGFHADVDATSATDGGIVAIPCVCDGVSDDQLKLALEHERKQLHE